MVCLNECMPRMLFFYFNCIFKIDQIAWNINTMNKIQIKDVHREIERFFFVWSFRCNHEVKKNVEC